MIKKNPLIVKQTCKGIVQGDNFGTQQTTGF